MPDSMLEMLDAWVMVGIMRSLDLLDNLVDHLVDHLVDNQVHQPISHTVQFIISSEQHSDNLFAELFEAIRLPLKHDEMGERL